MEHPTKGGRYYRDPANGKLSGNPPAAARSDKPSPAPTPAHAEIVIPPLPLKTAPAAVAPASDAAPLDNKDK